MTPNDPETNPAPAGAPAPNRQAGLVLGEGDPAERGEIATGDRRDMHYEADPDQLVVARALVRPEGPLPPENQSPGAAAADADTPPVEDVRVAPPGSSVWDARPPADDAGANGGPAGR